MKIYKTDALGLIKIGISLFWSPGVALVMVGAYTSLLRQEDQTNM